MLANLKAYVRQHHLALLALFVALGGTSYAAATGSIDSREIKNNSVRSKDIRNNEIRSSDVKGGSLLASDFKAGALPSGPPGPRGLPGPQGPAGVPGSARAFAHMGGSGLDLVRSKGVLGVANPGDDPRVNCFDLSFEPSNVVATPEFGSATLQLSASVTPNIVVTILNCPAPFRDAVVFTYTSAGTFYASFN